MLFGVNPGNPAAAKGYGGLRQSGDEHPHGSGDFQVSLQTVDFVTQMVKPASVFQKARYRRLITRPALLIPRQGSGERGGEGKLRARPGAGHG